MGEYFMMDCWGLDNDEPTQKPLNADLDDEDDEIEWFMGETIAVELPDPIEMQWNPEITGGGPAWEAFGTPSNGPRSEKGVRRQWAYPTKDPPLFHRDLVAALRECGVDNFDAYSTKIVDIESGAASEDYLAVNFIGLVKAADMATSVAVQHSDDGLVEYGLRLGRAERGCHSRD